MTPEDLDRMLYDTTTRDRVPSDLADRDSVKRLVAHVRDLVAQVRVYQERLQIDPGGSDKIDELEAAAQFLRHDLDQAKDSERRAVKDLEAMREAQAKDLSGAAWYVYDPEDGLELHRTADEAKARAEQIMEEESDRAASDGWREDIGSLEWGELISHGRACCIKCEKAPEGSDFDEIQEWVLR